MLRKKKCKISDKCKRKQMLGERSKKALEKRGLGIGVWRKFALGAN